MKGIIKLLLEGWSGNPTARPTARRMLINLEHIYKGCLKDGSLGHVDHSTPPGSLRSPNEYSGSSVMTKSSNSSGSSSFACIRKHALSSSGSYSSSSASSAMSGYKPPMILTPNSSTKDSLIISNFNPANNHVMPTHHTMV